MKPLINTLLLFSSLALTACGGHTDADETIRAAEMAIARGDMTAASSVAQQLTDSVNLSGLTARQLGRLSIVYMQLADSMDNANNVARATDAYRRAYSQQPDSAAIFYSSLPSETAQYSMMLSAIVGNQDHPFDMSELADSAYLNDSLHTDHGLER